MHFDLDKYRSTNLLMNQRGALGDEIEAAQRADELLAAGDMEGAGRKAAGAEAQ